jgi:cell division septal protein FtsQ
MYYRGSRTSLHEKFTPARSAKSVYGLRLGGPRKERQKEVSLFFKWEGDKKRKSGTAGKPATTFYRPGVTTVEDTPAYSEKKRSWVHQSPSHRRILLALKIGGLALLVVAVVWSKNKTTALLQDIAGLKLEKVSVDGNHYLAGDEVIQAAALPLGESMFKLDLNKAVERVQKMDWVQRVFIERRLPRSIVVSVRERKPVALLESGSLYGVDYEGMVLSSSPVLLREDLPLISGLRVQADAVGTTEMAESLQPALDFLQFL